MPFPADSSDDHLIDTVPPPEAIRVRLGLLLRESSLLRRLLRLAEQAEHERRRREQNTGRRP